MTRPKTRSDHAPAVLPTAREPGHSAHPLGRHLPTQRPARHSAAAPGGRTRRDLPQPASQADSRAAGLPGRGHRPTRKTGSPADQVGAEFAVQQIHQGLPVLGGRFGRPQVRLGLVDRADGGDWWWVVVDDPQRPPVRGPFKPYRARCVAQTQPETSPTKTTQGPSFPLLPEQS